MTLLIVILRSHLL